MMKITYTPTLENYLQYQLYKYSLSRQYKRQTGGLYLFLIAFLLLSIVLTRSHNYGWPVYIALVVFSLWFCPAYYRWNIRNQYRKYIKNALSAKTNEPVVLEISKNSLLAKNQEHPVSSIRQVTEIKACYFIELDAFSSFILSKNQEIEKFVQALTEKHKVKFVQNLRWKW